MMWIFGTLLVVSLLLLSLLALRRARMAVLEKVRSELVNKATDTATILDERITIFFTFLDCVSRNDFLHNDQNSYFEKTQYLAKEAKSNKNIYELSICDTSGFYYGSDGSTEMLAQRGWFQSAKDGKPFISEPYISATEDKLLITCSYPIKDLQGNVISVMMCDIDAFGFPTKLLTSSLAKQVNAQYLEERG
ncbi:methyl-accepting chemotaxis protein [Treponema phagedenis F0421]|nr:methyl-accepting chemotaxis protein [Treponema phagedenis F0421]